jgi:S1-C subfamily serine protease
VRLARQLALGLVLYVCWHGLAWLNGSDTRAILRLQGRTSGAHACPVMVGDEQFVLTNAHVTDRDGWVPYRYSNAYGEEGVLSAVSVNQAADIAVMRASKTLGNYYRVASKAPAIGERVRYIGYARSSRKAAYAEETFDRVVVRVVAGHLIVDKPGKPGSSGSCVLNEGGEVVAINARGEELDNGDLIGGLVGVWGDWLETSK